MQATRAISGRPRWRDAWSRAWVQNSKTGPAPYSQNAGRQCNATTRAGALGSLGARLFGARRFAHTPVRAPPAGGVASVVALLVEYRASSGTVQGFRRRLPGWHERLLAPHGLALLLVLVPSAGVRDVGGVVAFAARLGLAHTPRAGADAARACAALLLVDCGYVHFALRSATRPSPSSVLVGRVDVPLPRWALCVRAAKLARWTTPTCNRARFAFVRARARAAAARGRAPPAADGSRARALDGLGLARARAEAVACALAMATTEQWPAGGGGALRTRADGPTLRALFRSLRLFPPC
ncbi:hypothetical protein KFE25_010454 [Diacronema lutheri]|uniref:Uncharacterized protein n=1 Tax=Diacronema lutheri TaxID=2081491 RepID=A0A8J6C6M6_DIALT|nr:hypothetical protein KFE25_010454 [Diacronema lutheri]